MAGVELGGTKAIAALARGASIVESMRIATTDPEETLAALGQRLQAWRVGGHDFAAIGIGSFGPVGLDPNRVDYGFITTTPKSGWSATDVRGFFASRFDLPICFDTDVNGAALAETWWGSARGSDHAVYITIGTGIGGGIVVDGKPLHGAIHPEIGHLRVRRAGDLSFAGVCPFHGDCLEGLASGPAIAARAGVESATDLPADHPVWDEVAAELAELVAMLVLTVSPQRVLIGGGVGSGRSALLPAVRRGVGTLLADYVADFQPDDVIRSPALGGDAGVLGSTALAILALQ